MLAFALAVSALNSNYSIITRQRPRYLDNSSCIVRNAPSTTLVALGSSIQIFPILQLSYRIAMLSITLTPVILSYPLHLMHSYFSSSNESWWIHFLVYQLELAGPLFIKLGQWASTRRDLFTDETCDILTRLQSRITPHSIDHTKQVIKAMYGKQIDDVFSEFGVDPVGVGAVYKAALVDKYGVKSHVAVKILHPDVREQVAIDMHIIKLFGSLLEYVPGMVYLGPRKEVDTFCTMMTQQLDLRVEADNLAVFRRNFADVEGVSFPKPYLEMCGSDVLVEDFREGILLSDWLEKGESIYDGEIARLGLNAFMMLLMDNFAHADLHAGNVILSFKKRTPSSLFREESVVEIATAEMPRLKACGSREEWIQILTELNKEGYEPKLILVDVGLISVLNEKSKTNLFDVVQAALQFDGYSIADLIISRSTHPHLVINAEEEMRRLVNTISLDASGRLPLSQIYSSNIMRGFTKFVREHRIHLDGDFVGLSVACLLIEGIGRKLKSDLDIMDAVAEYTRFD